MTLLILLSPRQSRSIYHSVFRLVMHKFPIKTKYNLINVVEHQKDEHLGFTLFTFFQINMYNFIKVRSVCTGMPFHSKLLFHRCKNE